jgi:hypothetical protein
LYHRDRVLFICATCTLASPEFRRVCPSPARLEIQWRQGRLPWERQSLCSSCVSLDITTGPSVSFLVPLPAASAVHGYPVIVYHVISMVSILSYFSHCPFNPHPLNTLTLSGSSILSSHATLCRGGL